MFLDRDGVINQDLGYVHRWSDFVFLPGAVAALRRLHEAGHPLVVVTNQSGIARGYFTEADFAALTQQLSRYLAAEGAPLAATHYCPHLPQGSVQAYARECDCRKPAPGQILRAAKQLGLPLQDAILIGDRASDIQAARAAGIGTAFFIGSQTPQLPPQWAAPDGVFQDLAACVDALLDTGLED